MSYCNRAASEALKRIGFDEPTSRRHKDGINGTYIENVPRNHNLFEGEYSAPDHLQAADWLFVTHGVGVTFNPNGSLVYDENTDEDFYSQQPDHRDAAIIAACEIVEKRKEQGQ